MNEGAIIQALVNAGGFAIFAAAMFYLHVTTLKQFRDELQLERDGFAARNQRFVEALDRQTSVLVGALEKVHDDLRDLERQGRAGGA